MAYETDYNPGRLIWPESREPWNLAYTPFPAGQQLKHAEQTSLK